MNEIINFYKIKKIESHINFQMKSNITNNYFNLNKIKQNIENKLSNQTKEINELKILLKKNEINNIIINENENYFKNFKIENMKNIKNLNNNEGTI